MIKNYLTDEELLCIARSILESVLDKDIDSSIYYDELSIKVYRKIANVAADRSHYETVEGSLKKLECLRKSILRNDVFWYALISSTWILSMINLIYNIF